MSNSPNKDNQSTPVKQMIENTPPSTPVQLQHVKAQPVTVLFSPAKSVSIDKKQEQLETRMDKIESSITQLIDLFKERHAEKEQEAEKKVIKSPVSHLVPFKVANTAIKELLSANVSLESSETNKISKQIDGIINSDALNANLSENSENKYLDKVSRKTVHHMMDVLRQIIM